MKRGKITSAELKLNYYTPCTMLGAFHINLFNSESDNKVLLSP